MLELREAVLVGAEVSALLLDCGCGIICSKRSLSRVFCCFRCAESQAVRLRFGEIGAVLVGAVPVGGDAMVAETLEVARVRLRRVDVDISMAKVPLWSVEIGEVFQRRCDSSELQDVLGERETEASAQRQSQVNKSGSATAPIATENAPPLSGRNGNRIRTS